MNTETTIAATATEINHVCIVKKNFMESLKAHFSRSGNNDNYYYIQSCAYSNLLTQFGVSKGEIDEMVKAIRENK